MSDAFRLSQCLHVHFPLYRKHQGHIRLTSNNCGEDESTSLVVDEHQEDISHEDNSRVEEKATRSLFLSVIKMQEIHMLTDSANHFKELAQRCLKVEGMAIDENEGLEEALDKPTDILKKTRLDST